MTQHTLGLPRGWGFESIPQGVRDTISEELPSIIEATLGQWLSKFEEKQGAWLQEVLREQQAASQAASQAAPQLWEGKVDELAEAVERYRHAVGGIAAQTEAVVREAARDAARGAVMEALEQMPTSASKSPSLAEVRKQGSASQSDPQHPGASRPARCAGTAPLPHEPTAVTLQSAASLPRGATAGSDQSGDGGPAVAGAPPTPSGKPKIFLTLKQAREHYNQRRQNLHLIYLQDRALGRRQGEGNLGYFVRTRTFDYIVMAVVLLNVTYMVYDVDHSFRTGVATASTNHVTIEGAFWAFYAVELGLRLAVNKLNLFSGPQRWLRLVDVFLLVTGLIDLVATVLYQRGAIGGATTLKVFRAMRLTRLLRMQRLLVTPDTHMLLKCLGATAASLAGPCVLIYGYLLVMSLWIVTAVRDHLTDSGGTLPPDTVSFLTDSFGSVFKSVFTLYHSFTGGSSWMPIYAPLAAAGELGVGLPFVLFHFVYTFLMVNNVLCVFIGKVILSTLETYQGMTLDQNRKDRRDVDWILEWCEAEYGPGDTINYRDFLELVNKVELRVHFTARGLHIDDARMVFKALAPEPVDTQPDFREWDFNVDRAAFFEACMRLKREVSATDVIAAHALLVRSSQKQQALTEEVILKMDTLEARLKAEMRRAVEKSGMGPNAPR